MKEIENSDELPDIHPRAHYFNEMEHSPGKSSFIKKDFCEKCDLHVGGYSLPGQREVHIPDLSVSVHTFRRLGHQHIFYLSHRCYLLRLLSR